MWHLSICKYNLSKVTTDIYLFYLFTENHSIGLNNAVDRPNLLKQMQRWIQKLPKLNQNKKAKVLLGFDK